MRAKPKRLQLSLTLQFTFFFIIAAGLIYYFFIQKFEEEVLDKYKFKADFISKYIEQNLNLFRNNEISDKEQLIRFLLLNDAGYFILKDNAGNIIDAFNPELSEYYLKKADNSNSISYDESIYNLNLPVYDNHLQKGSIQLGIKTGTELAGLKKKNLLTALFSLSLLFAGIVFTYFLSTLSFKPLAGIISALGKSDLNEQKILLDSLLDTLDKNDRKDKKIVISKFRNAEINLLAQKVFEILDELEKSSGNVKNLNERLNGVFRDKMYEVGFEINQRKRTESHLKKSEDLFKLLFETAPIGMIIISDEGRAIKANKAFCRTVGYEWHEIIGANIKYIFNGNKSGDVKSTFQLLRENDSLDTECSLVRKDGRKIAAILKTIKIENDEGALRNILIQVLDITEIKNAQNELVAALDKATEAERLKSAFLAQMSHEIRTPLNVILPSIPILAEELGSKDEEIMSILSAVEHASKRLHNTIDMILSLSAVQSGSYKPRFEKFDIVEDLKTLAKEFNQIVKDRGLELNFSNLTSDSEIWADRDTVNQIFQNLIGNAVKYTLKGQISISVEDYQKNRIIVKVKDSGIGISSRYIKNLFSPFSQEDTGRTRKYEGNGLGLALVKEYVRINRGEISVESEKNVGSTFSVHFEKCMSISSTQQERIVLTEIKTLFA